MYPRVAHQRCWVHKMRNLLEKVRRRDHDAVKADAQAIYLAESRRQHREVIGARLAGITLVLCPAQTLVA
jgi:putative transposase